MLLRRKSKRARKRRRGDSRETQSEPVTMIFKDRSWCVRGAPFFLQEKKREVEIREEARDNRSRDSSKKKNERAGREG